MNEQLMAATAPAQRTLLDPRTKIALTLTVSTVILGAAGKPGMQFVKPALAAVPFVLLLAERRRRGAAIYAVLYAAALAAGHRLLVLDEPTSGLDRDHMQTLADLLREAHERDGAAMFVVTHDPEFILACCTVAAGFVFVCRTKALPAALPRLATGRLQDSRNADESVLLGSRFTGSRVAGHLGAGRLMVPPRAFSVSRGTRGDVVFKVHGGVPVTVHAMGRVVA